MIETERLILRQFLKSDAEDVAECSGWERQMKHGSSMKVLDE